MISSAGAPQLDRRTLLRSAILLVGGSAAGASMPALAASDSPMFFSPLQFELLSEASEIMIPRTDTAGAKDAGVPQAIDALMANWASARRKAEFRGLIDQFGGAGLLSLPQPARVELVRTMDAQKLAAGDAVYGKFRELVLTLYYLSEVGATEELRYELIPGKWDPAVAIDPTTRAWAV